MATIYAPVPSDKFYALTPRKQALVCYHSCMLTRRHMLPEVVLTMSKFAKYLEGEQTNLDNSRLMLDKIIRTRRLSLQERFATESALRSLWCLTMRNGFWALDRIIRYGNSTDQDFTHNIEDIYNDIAIPDAFSSARFTPTMEQLCKQAHDDVDFSMLPVLADMMEDEYGDDVSKELVDHVRGGDRHRRGCWVVDMLLQKK